jgi:hypothetical protein
MILTENQVKMYKKFSKVPEKNRPMVEALFDTIEALRQENGDLHEKLVQFMSEENEKIIELQQQLEPLEALQQENKELKDRLREILEG